MKRLLALLTISILAILGVFTLQVGVVGPMSDGDAPEQALVRVLVWALGGACLLLLFVVLQRIWAYAQALEEAAESGTEALAMSEQQLRVDTARRRAAEDALRRSKDHAEALVRTAASLSAHFDRDTLLKTICQETAGVLDMPVAAILLLDGNREQLVLAASVGLAPEIGEQAPPLPLAWFREQVGDQAREPYLVPDLLKEAQQYPLSEMLVQAGFRTLVLVELVYREQLVGILLASTLHETRALDETDLKLVRGLADQAAQAITNTNLFRAFRQLAQRTRSQAQQMQRIMDAAPDGLLVLDADLHVQLANPAAREMIAQLAPGVIGDGPLLRLADSDTGALLVDCAAEGGWRELVVRDKPSEIDGSDEIYYEVTARALDGESGGTDGAWIVVIRDMTTARQQRRAAESQDRLATVGQLAAGIAHDFNNIMAVITLYSQSLERNPDFPKRQDYLATISQQAQHASALISQILDFSRGEAMERGRLDLLPFVKEMVKLLRRTLPESITLTLDADAGEYEVRADPALLRQALMNLALNGRDAMPEGGALQISLAAVRVTGGEGGTLHGLQGGKYMCLSVADTGTGMSEAVQGRLFEPFFSTKETGKATGMGLTQVYGIVKQHGGEVEVDSRPGHGTRVTLYLPALHDDEPLPPPREMAWQQVSGDAPTVLLVEDHAPTREAIGDTLELLGYNVLVATTGREALALYDAGPEAVDVVLSDMVMPEMGGVQLYRELMARDGKLKMIVMTGYPLEDEGRSLLEQGIVDWIRKPFSPDALGEKLRAIREENGA